MSSNEHFVVLFENADALDAETMMMNDDDDDE